LWVVGCEHTMPRKVDGLFEHFANFQALIRAAQVASRGKRRKPGVARFLANLEKEVLTLERELTSGCWRPGNYVVIDIRDPKPRKVSAAPFRDRVVHHALCAVIEPIFARGFIADSFANRLGKGTHRAVRRYEQYRDRFSHALRCDIYRYFPAIDHEVLKADLRRRIGCAATLRVLDRIIDGSNPQEPVEVFFPGDDLFTPSNRRRGLPIGNLTSQLFANIYLDGLDHFVKEILRAPYLRYVDDFVLFNNDVKQLKQWRERIVRYLEGRRLLLHPTKTFIHDVRVATPFLGFVLEFGGGRRLPEDNVRRFRNRLRGLRTRWLAGHVTQTTVEQHLRAWIAHARHADTFRLRRAIFRGGWFDPSGEVPRRPGRSRVPAGFCGAVPGTTTQRMRVPPTETGTTQPTGTTTLASELPVHLSTRVKGSKDPLGES